METNNRMLTNFVSIGRYSHELLAIATLITSTNVLCLIANLQNYLITPQKRTFT